MHVAHVHLPGASILIDAGLGDPGSAWYQHFAARWSGFSPTPGLSGWMAAVGIAPESITHVLITHAHEDHYAGVAADRDGQLVVCFPRARHLIGRADWDGNLRRDDAASTLALRLGLLQHRGLLDLIDGPLDVVPGVTMLPTPGESPGHCVVRVESRGARCYFLGDLVHHAAEIEHPDWMPGQNRDPDGLRASRARLFAEIAAHPNTPVLFTHALPPAWGRIVSAGSGYRWSRAG
jgi:glyoxylase-like metal-dependent hydrolase (beta-lactamase superfamily II)